MRSFLLPAACGLVIGMCCASASFIYQKENNQRAAGSGPSAAIETKSYDFWSIVQEGLPLAACERVQARYAAEGQPGLCLKHPEEVKR